MYQSYIIPTLICPLHLHITNNYFCVKYKRKKYINLFSHNKIKNKNSYKLIFYCTYLYVVTNKLTLCLSTKSLEWPPTLLTITTGQNKSIKIK